MRNTIYYTILWERMFYLEILILKLLDQYIKTFKYLMVSIVVRRNPGYQTKIFYHVTLLFLTLETLEGSLKL